MDPASSMGLTERDTDFGETMHVWGVHEGAYVELPVLGPFDRARDASHHRRSGAGSLGLCSKSPANYAATGVRMCCQNFGDRYTYRETVNSILYDSADGYAQARILYLENRRHDLAALRQADRRQRRLFRPLLDQPCPLRDPEGQEMTLREISRRSLLAQISTAALVAALPAACLRADYRDGAGTGRPSGRRHQPGDQLGQIRDRDVRRLRRHLHPLCRRADDRFCRPWVRMRAAPRAAQRTTFVKAFTGYISRKYGKLLPRVHRRQDRGAVGAAGEELLRGQVDRHPAGRGAVRGDLPGVEQVRPGSVLRHADRGRSRCSSPNAPRSAR